MLLNREQVSTRDESLADALDGFLLEVPSVTRDACGLNSCGPISFAFAVYLRACDLHGGLIHVTGRPAGRPSQTGHYMAVSGWLVIDFTYRQFDKRAPVPVLYERADLTLPLPGKWRPWTAISGELEHDDPLYPDFVEYPGNPPGTAIKYVPDRLALDQWVTPWDER